MGIQKEIWLDAIVEQLFAQNDFLSKSFNADEFVNQGRTVHIPNAGAASKVEKNRTTLPASVKVRADKDLTFNLDEFTTDPIRIPHADTVELSYNKRNSVIKTDKAKLKEAVSEAILYSWLPTTSLPTTGEAVGAHLAGATGNRKLFTKKEIRQTMNLFNKQNIPQTGRFLLCDAEMYGQLLDDLTEKEASAFHSLVDVANGVLGKIDGFSVMMRSRVGRANGSGKKEWSVAGAATDSALALAWHEDSVCRALGEVNMFENENDPTFYGDIYSFLARCGGRAMREDVAGLVAIKQEIDS